MPEILGLASAAVDCHRHDCDCACLRRGRKAAGKSRREGVRVNRQVHVQRRRALRGAGNILTGKELILRC